MLARIRNQWSIFQHPLRHRRQTRQIQLRIQRMQRCYHLMDLYNELHHRHRLFMLQHLLLLLRRPTIRSCNLT